MNALDSIDASEYDVIRKRELVESERLMRSDIDNQKNAEREKKKAVVQSRPSDKDELIKLSVQRILLLLSSLRLKILSKQPRTYMIKVHIALLIIRSLREM